MSKYRVSFEVEMDPPAGGALEQCDWVARVLEMKINAGEYTDIVEGLLVTGPRLAGVVFAETFNTEDKED